jgi:2,3-bisphosphoglycerate-independent phosphoglycerate mutase
MPPVVLCILDGWGLSKDKVSNAPVLAKTPNFDYLWNKYPKTTLLTHGLDVGLPKGQMGNSEVGHMNIGAGRIVSMDLGQIDQEIKNENFFKNEILLSHIREIKKRNGRAHLMSLFSDGGVHGHINHLIASIRLFQSYEIPIILHLITDGRDVAPQSAIKFVDKIRPIVSEELQVGTVIGRYYAMDRDNRWERVELAYNAIVFGKSERKIPDIKLAITKAYESGVSDEFILPTVINQYSGIRENDGFFCLNYRADRARQILNAIGDPSFLELKIENRPQITNLLGMVEYSENHNTFMSTCYPKPKIKNTLGEWVSLAKKKQFRLAETEKYPHVTFFLNGGNEKPLFGETRNMPRSPKVATYDLKPAMSSEAVTEILVDAIESNYDLIVANYANPDMVGHTGNLNAAIEACEAVDKGIGRLVGALEKVDGTLFLTADHGNCEIMTDPVTGNPHTSHTLNPVPAVLFNGPNNKSLSNGGRLSDIAPTILELMDLTPPPEMTGNSLLL